jgi:hypothetical protein
MNRDNSLEALRHRTRVYQEEFDLALIYLTVRDIPRDQLPYKEFGRKRLKRRRYQPSDVVAFEAVDRIDGGDEKKPKQTRAV